MNAMKKLFNELLWIKPKLNNFAHQLGSWVANGIIIVRIKNMNSKLITINCIRLLTLRNI